MSKNITGGLGDESLEPMGLSLDGLDIDVHHGSHDFPDITAQVPDTEDIQQFGVRFEDAVKHMSVNKYESEASMIREYVANMAATCLDAQERLDGDYTPVIHIAYYPSSQTLIMEDNGMGMSQEEIDAVGTQLGVSTNRYHSDRGGKYGIGMLSGLKGVGLDGAFFMHSRSRRTDEYVRGLWSAYGFKEIEELPDKLEEGQYGTRFEFPLKDPDIEIQGAIMGMTQWSRIPVLYTERNENGALIEDDEVGGRSDTPFLGEDGGSGGDLVLETDAFRAVHSPNASKDTILLDVPIERNADLVALDDGNDLPYRSVDILFKSEDEEIVAGPHEGLTRVSDGEYAQMPEEKQEQYIPERECSPSDIWTPSPAGDRDRFEENPDFWNWLVDQFAEKFRSEIRRILSDAGRVDRIIDLPKEDIDLVVQWMDSEMYDPEWNHAQMRKRLEKYGIEGVDKEVRQNFAAISHKIGLCERGKDPWGKYARDETPIYEILLQTPDHADVWMASHPSHKKAKVVWEDDDGHKVVRVEKSNLETLEEAFGWRRLNYVEKSTLDEFDISEETRDRFYNDTTYENPNAGRDAPDRVLTLHQAKPTDDNDRGYKDWTRKESARYLRAYFEARAEGTTPSRGYTSQEIDQLILFPSNSEQKLSDYLGVLGLGGVRLANCTVKVWDYLQDLDRVKRIEEYQEMADTFELSTSAGTMTVSEAQEQAEAVVLHLLSQGAFSNMEDQPEMQEAARWFETEFEPSDYMETFEHEDVIYGPVTTDLLGRVLPEIREEDTYVANFEQSSRLPDETVLNYRRDTDVYLYANLHRWRDTKEYKLIKSQNRALYSGMKGIIDGLAQLHDGGEDAPSQRETVDGETYETMLEVAEG